MATIPSEITCMDDTIDSRDIIDRIEWLEGDEDRTHEESEELAALKALQDEAEGYAADWLYGATLIRESYFEEYAQELAEDIGAIDRNAGWPAYCIDWEQAARDLSQDYSMVEFAGVNYWIR